MLDKSKIIEKQIKNLHSRSLPDEIAIQIFKLGKPAYDYLFTTIDNPTLTDYQVINLLRLLYMMRYHGNLDAFVNKLLFLIQDDRIKVRSVASIMSVNLLRIAETFNYLNIPLQREKLISFLENALIMELDSASTQVVQDFLE
ncbi:hypothetical protein [Nostoc sp. UHCC 0252]|uniref:hypothetical protein n=1 Tax=Nostoc sp. UHCC 0252 TaxID=3110241 RepID=UPI002B1FCDBF|nr:hypothetical protein [Nostoc sp. UHCC 0252]MEA5601459.1 hypothetical protein [Nostoc sp. UHCC 0252]